MSAYAGFHCSCCARRTFCDDRVSEFFMDILQLENFLRHIEVEVRALLHKHVKLKLMNIRNFDHENSRLKTYRGCVLTNTPRTLTCPTNFCQSAGGSKPKGIMYFLAPPPCALSPVQQISVKVRGVYELKYTTTVNVFFNF